MWGWFNEAENAGLALEAGQPVGVICQVLRQDFDGDVASELRIAGTVDLAHPADTEHRVHLVHTERRPANVGEAGIPRRFIRS